MAKKKTQKNTKKPELGKKALTLLDAVIPRNRKVKIVLYAMIGLFFLMAAMGFAGQKGTIIHGGIFSLLGYAWFTIPALCIVAVWRLKQEIETTWADRIMLLLMSLSLVSLFHIFFSDAETLAGGSIGNGIGSFLKTEFNYFSLFFLFGIMVIGAILVFDPHMSFYKKSKKSLEEKMKERESEKESDTDLQEKVDAAIEKNAVVEKPSEPVKKGFTLPTLGKKKDEEKEDLSMSNVAGVFASSYKIPPLSLLGTTNGKPSTGDIKANANLIQRTLMNFGIPVEMDEISVGPTVTRYAMKPAQGVRLSRLASLQNELALALAAKSIRIEAPIPGRSLVGIEVPNTIKSSIGMGSILAEPEYQNSNKPLLVSLGKGVSGKSYFTDLAKMPHGLIAGATGSGKSVTIHNIVMSLLYKNGPDMLRFIMVDPKRVEMTLYKKIPHLLTPVITDPKKAVLALKWAIKEMERRYGLLQKCAVRDIDSYHKTIVAPAYKGLSIEDIQDQAGELPEKMPYIVIIIDELSDIMSAYPRELESAIVRLAQMSRAVGIHLLLATQRPSVNVITGLIKANVPSRMALRVASQIDSRTIIDSQGAEKLLGKGDMLFKGEGFNEPIRVQCPYVSEEEVKAVVNYIQKNYKFELDDDIIIPDENLQEGEGGFETNGENDDDPMYEEAKQIVVASKKASTSYLQRRLSIGYSRAARIIDMMEDRGVIGPANGSKARDVYEQGSEEVEEPEENYN